MTTNRKIKLRQTKTIAVVSDIVMPTVKSEYLMGIAKYAQERRNFTIRSVDLANIRSGNPLDGCDGVIMDTDESDVIELVKAAGLPVVDTTCATSDPALIGVDNDIRRMGNMAAEWFLRRGFRSFAYCGIGPGHRPSRQAKASPDVPRASRRDRRARIHGDLPRESAVARQGASSSRFKLGQADLGGRPGQCRWRVPDCAPEIVPQGVWNDRRQIHPLREDAHGEAAVLRRSLERQGSRRQNRLLDPQLLLPDIPCLLRTRPEPRRQEPQILVKSTRRRCIRTKAEINCGAKGSAY